MNRHTLTRINFGAALLLFAACTQDELPGNGNILPTGKYPLEIASVTMNVTHSQQPWSADAPQTRVSESDDRNSSVWDGGESIGMRIANNGNETAVYTLQSDKTILQPADKPLYWKNTTASKVCAWFPADGKVDLSKQTSELAYALYAETTEAVNYNTTDIKLPFEHKLAKVRVVLTGEKKDGVTDVKINTFTSCTLKTDGTLTAGDTKGYIPMVQTTYNGETYWEANVMPVSEDGTTDYEITHVKVNDKEITLSTPFAPQAAKVNTIELNVNKKVTEIKGGETITEPSEYLMKGDYSQTVTINCEGKVTLTLDGVTSTAATAIKVESGHPTIIVKGENLFEQPSEVGSSTIALNGEDAHITLDGQGSGKLTIKQIHQGGGNGEAVIGGADNSSTGDIEIKGMSLHIDLSGRRSLTGAVIGSGTAFYGQAICGDISISDTELTVTDGDCKVWGAVVGTGMGQPNRVAKCGDITITLRQGDTKDAFLNRLDVKPLSDPNVQKGDKVGKGNSVNGGSCETGKIIWYNDNGTEIK